MNRIELTYRLRQLGIRKPQFAVKLGVAVDTVYQWEEAPQYAALVVELMEENAKLKFELKKREVKR